MKVSSSESIYTYGLAFVGFSFFFVRLNHIAEYVFIGLVVVWLIQKVKNRDFSLHPTFWDVPILLFLAWSLLMVVFAADPQYSFAEWRKALPRFLIFWFVVNVIRTKRQFRTVLFAISVGFGVLCLLEVAYYFYQGNSALDFSLSGETRAGGLTGSSQWLSTYLILGVPLVWFGVGNKEMRGRRMTYILIAGVMIAAIVVVHTRATWLALIVVMAVFFVCKILRNFWQVVGVIGAVFLILALSFFSVKRPLVLTESQVANPATMQLRLNTWSFAFERILEQPALALTGVGYGKHSFQKAYPDLGAEFHTHIHNMFLAQAIQLGIPGLVLFVWIFWVVLKKTFQGFQDFPNTYVGMFSLAIFLATIGLMVRNVFDNMFVGSIVYVFCLLIGLLSVLQSLNELEGAGNIARKISPGLNDVANGMRNS